MNDDQYYEKVLLTKNKRNKLSSCIKSGYIHDKFSYRSMYEVSKISKTFGESKKFIFVTNDHFHVDDYQYDILYYVEKYCFFNYDRGDTPNENIDYSFSRSGRTTIINKGKCIIKINDAVGREFYMYMKNYCNGRCLSCDGETITDYRIVYASSLTNLLNFIYTPIELEQVLYIKNN